MLTPKELVDHISVYLPMSTNLFSNTIALDSVTIASNVLTINTTTDHNLSVGGSVIITEGRTPNPVSSVSDLGDGFYLVTFSDEHDYTGGADVEEDIVFSGFNEAQWNTAFTVESVVDWFSITVADPGVAPTFTTAYGYERRPASIFGVQIVASTPTVTSFTLELGSDIPAIPDGSLIEVEVVRNVRVAAVDNVDRAQDIYTKQSESNLWLFVIMSDVDVSKDRHVHNDAIGTYSASDEMRMRHLQNFSTVVFFPADKKISGATAQQTAYGDLYKNLTKTLFGYTGMTQAGDGSDFAIVPTGHGVGVYNTAYYTHVYDWQLPVDLTVFNGFSYYEDVAFRRISMTLEMFERDNLEKLSFAVDLEA